MKTDAIRSALGSLGFTHDVSEAMAELNALEESHAEMVRALMEVLERVQLSPSRAATVTAALKKAGAL